MNSFTFHRYICLVYVGKELISIFKNCSNGYKYSSILFIPY